MALINVFGAKVELTKLIPYRWNKALVVTTTTMIAKVHISLFLVMYYKTGLVLFSFTNFCHKQTKECIRNAKITNTVVHISTLPSYKMETNFG